MQVNRWIDPVTGLAPLIKGAGEPPAIPRTQRPTFKNVFVSGTVASVKDSVLQMLAITIAPHSNPGLRLLNGGNLAVDYDPEELPAGVRVRAGQRQPAGADFGEGAWSSEAFPPLLAEMRQGVAQRRAGDLHQSLERRVHRQDQEDRA